jgi:hypothetical protein
MKCRFYVATIAYLAYFSYLRSVFQDSWPLTKTSTLLDENSALLDEKSTSLV